MALTVNQSRRGLAWEIFTVIKTKEKKRKKEVRNASSTSKTTAEREWVVNVKKTPIWLGLAEATGFPRFFWTASTFGVSAVLVNLYSRSASAPPFHSPTKNAF